MGNKHISYMSIGCLVIALFRIMTKTDFASLEESEYRNLNHARYSVSILVYTSVTVMVNKHISYMSIGCLVVPL